MQAEEVSVLYRDKEGFTQVVNASDIQGIYIELAGSESVTLPSFSPAPTIFLKHLNRHRMT